jgi:hypothetical protein
VRATSEYQRALAFGVRLRVTGSTSTIPNRGIDLGGAIK